MAAKGGVSHRQVDMTGQRVGKLTVIKPNDSVERKRGQLYWDCLCDCGKTTRVASTSLRKEPRTESCGCLKKTHFVDHTGETHNSLTFVKFLGKDNSKNFIYEMLCTCGNTIVSQASDVRTGKIKTCGCGKFKQQQDTYLADPTIIYQKSIYRGYQAGANGRNYSFNLTLEQLIQLIDGNCYYCGDGPTNIHRHSKKRKCAPDAEPYMYNGIDRVDNDRGYEPDNVVTCCKSCNIAKHMYTQEAYISQAYKIVEQDKKRKGLK